MKNILLAAACAVALIGCAKKAENISSTYVSPLQYQNLTCNQIAEESARVASRAASVSGSQNKQAKNDAIATGVGVVVFWPALLFLSPGKDQSAEVGRLKGEMEALEQASIAKNCGIQFKAAPA